MPLVGVGAGGLDHLVLLLDDRLVVVVREACAAVDALQLLVLV